MAGMRCPKCGSTQFKSLRILYEEGTKTYTRSHYSSTNRYSERSSSTSSTTSTTSSTTQTLLAKSVSPPEAPEAPIEKANYNGIVIVMLSIVIFIYTCNIPHTIKLVSEISIFLIALVLYIVGVKNKKWNETEYPKLREEYEREYKQWQYYYELWQHSYICRKCGNIFTD